MIAEEQRSRTQGHRPDARQLYYGSRNNARQARIVAKIQSLQKRLVGVERGGNRSAQICGCRYEGCQVAEGEDDVI